MNDRGPFEEPQNGGENGQNEGFSETNNDSQNLGTGPEPAGKAFNYLNLRSDTPDISPHKAGGDLDLDAGPYAHVITGLIKQSGSTGSEAWMHYVVAMLLILDGQELFTDGSDSPENKDDLQDFQNPDNER